MGIAMSSYYNGSQEREWPGSEEDLEENQMTIDSIMHPATPSKAQLLAAYRLTFAVAETIRELGEVPSGHIFANIMHKVDLAGYQHVIDGLKRAGLVEETSAHLLRWVGPLKGAK